MPLAHRRYLFYAHNHLHIVDDLLSHHAGPAELAGATRTLPPSVCTGLTPGPAELQEKCRIWAYAARSDRTRAALVVEPGRGDAASPRTKAAGAGWKRQAAGHPRSGEKEGGREERGGRRGDKEGGRCRHRHRRRRCRHQ